MSSFAPDEIIGALQRPGLGRSRSELAALGFLARLRNQRTRDSYGTTLRQFFAFCETAGVEPIEAGRVQIEIFARECEMRGLAASTVATKLNAIAGFYKYAFIDGLIPANPMLHVARPSIQRVSTSEGLTRTQFADFLRCSEDRPHRDQALVCLLGLNGLRISEATGIDIEDLGRHHGQRTAKILRKGGKTQIIPLAPRTTWAVEQTAHGRTEGPLLLTRDGHRMDRRTAGRVVAAITLDAGISKRITPHSLRHTFVTMALDSGQAERDIAISTGHADTRMVAYYDRGRESIVRNSTHAVAAWVEGAL